MSEDLRMISSKDLARRQELAEKLQAPPIGRHRFLADVDNRCLTCKQVQMHPLHGVDPDGTEAIVNSVDANGLEVRETISTFAAEAEPAPEPSPETVIVNTNVPAEVHEMPVEALPVELDAEQAKAFTAKRREDLARRGIALPDGSFPIESKADLLNAISAVGRASNPAAAKAHIRKRARALGLTALLPESWRQTSEATEREEPAALPEGLPATKAFLTEVGGRTLLTAPAATFAPTWEKALTPNEHFLWMQGAFVGAEKANRNGAFWSTADLEMGEPTVKHGPLNWLHEAKHVIGTIADAKLVTPGPESAAAGGIREPHINAMAVVWKWIYPDEAFVLEEASDQGKLWYSMECVGREVACVGDDGCGESYPYMDVMRGAASICPHIRQRSSTRRMVDPTFLGGAVIVPPVRPGWAEADARILREAASLAEVAYEAAGQPDMPAAQWEALMAQVVGYAHR